MQQIGQKDYYQILEVSRTSTPAQIKKQFRTLALKYHPDRNSAEGSAERFSEIIEAYDTLSDPKKRQSYDSNPTSYKSRIRDYVNRFDAKGKFERFKEVLDDKLEKAEDKIEDLGEILRDGKGKINITKEDFTFKHLFSKRQDITGTINYERDGNNIEVKYVVKNLDYKDIAEKILIPKIVKNRLDGLENIPEIVYVEMNNVRN